MDTIVQPLVDFNQLSNLGRQQNSGSQDDGKKNNKNNLAGVTSTRLDAMGFDRYAYTSNCPMKYTDPSGHCNKLEAIAGIGLIAITDIAFALPLVAEIISTGVVTPPAIGGATLELVIVLPLNIIGIVLIIDSDCIKITD